MSNRTGAACAAKPKKSKNEKINDIIFIKNTSRRPLVLTRGGIEVRYLNLLCHIIYRLKCSQ